MRALECRQFSFFYGSSCILENISFQLERGDLLTILGPNGSGKSTLLKCLLRLVESGKSCGELLINDRPLSAYTQMELARQLAYVPQAGGRIPPFLVEDFVNLSRYPYSWRGSAAGTSQSVSEALELTSTASLAKRRMDTLSGGQRQRVYLAAALAQDTNILLLDEPASFLDPHHVFTMNELLKTLHNEKGMTIVTVTHDLNLPFELGSKNLVIRHGKQIYFGSGSDMISLEILESAFSHRFSYLKHPLTGNTIIVI